MLKLDYDNLLDKKRLEFNLKNISLFIAIYEYLSNSIIENVKFMYASEIKFQDNRIIYNESKEYQQEIRDRLIDKHGNKNILKSSILWLIDGACLNMEEYDQFLEIKQLRNKIVHEMLNYIVNGFEQREMTAFCNLLKLLEKIDKWWINEIEIPISGEYKPGEYNEDDVVSLGTLFYQVVIDSILTDSEDK